MAIIMIMLNGPLKVSQLNRSERRCVNVMLGDSAVSDPGSRIMYRCGILKLV